MKPRFVIRKKETGCIVGYAHTLGIARGHLNSIRCLLFTRYLEIVNQETGDTHSVEEPADVEDE